MLKLVSTMIFSAMLVSTTNPISDKSNVLDQEGKLILMQSDAVAVMPGQCKSYRVSKNPPLVPRLKCRFS
ncbi:hypothetical protein [Bdellovibrio sp. HCB337]|uniref:hypothetical protein n=1 Tax=Bdellovibrio sp. HCB337 TaxID=3394358 RepID=UPI0039A74011